MTPKLHFENKLFCISDYYNLFIYDITEETTKKTSIEVNSIFLTSDQNNLIIFDFKKLSLLDLNGNIIIINEDTLIKYILCYFRESYNFLLK